MMPSHFENSEKVKLAKSELALPKQFETGTNFDGKHSLQDFNAKEMYLHPTNQWVLFQKRRKMFCFHTFRMLTRCRFQNVPVRVPFSSLPF